MRISRIVLLLTLCGTLLASCMQDDSLTPPQAQAEQEAQDLILQDETSSVEFRRLFLEMNGIRVPGLTEAEQLLALRLLKAPMDPATLEATRDGIREQIRYRSAASGPITPSTARLARKSGPLSQQASDASMNDRYGYRFAYKDDEVFVGADGAGKVYVNTLANGTLTETQILTPSIAVPSFGSSIAVSGFSLLVGAGGLFDGYIFVFEKQNGSWVETQVIYKDGGFDFARVLEINAQYFVTGFRDTTRNVPAAALIYRRDDHTGQWGLHQSVPVSTLIWDADFFDKRLVVSGFAAPIGTAFQVIERVGQTWSETAFVVVPGGIFPRAVATHNNRIVVNGLLPFNDTYVYKRVGSSWQQEGVLSIPGVVPFAQTRWVDIDGNRAVVSVPAYGGGDAVYEYQRSGSTWSLIATHTPGSGDTQMWFGEDIKIKDADILVGAPGGGQQFDPNPQPAGQLFIF